MAVAGQMGSTAANSRQENQAYFQNPISRFTTRFISKTRECHHFYCFYASRQEVRRNREEVGKNRQKLGREAGGQRSVRTAPNLFGTRSNIKDLARMSRKAWKS